MKDNKLIAEFMGLPQEQYLPDQVWTLTANELQYHISWDCLMPVIREVLITIDVEEVFWQEWFDCDELKANMLDCDIDGAYKEVVQLIKQIKTYRDGEH